MGRSISQARQENGNSLQALRSILRAEGVGGLFVGGREQLIREIPFNAIQFTVYEVSQPLSRGRRLVGAYRVSRPLYLASDD